MAKYPKLRNGPNPVGEALYRALQRTDAPFISAEGVGCGANKYGGGGEVYGGLDDGFYCLGSTNPDADLPPFAIMASDNARGVFKKRMDAQTSAFVIPNLNYVWGGYGVVPTSDINLSANHGHFVFSKTKQGRNLTDFLTVDLYIDGRYADRAFFLEHGAKANGEWNFGITFLNNLGVMYKYTKDGAKTWETNNFDIGFYKGTARNFRLSPTSSLMIIPVYVTFPGAPYPYQDSTKATQLCLVTDCGDTITPISGGDYTGMLELGAHPGDSYFDGTDWASVNHINNRILSHADATGAVPLENGGYLLIAKSEAYDTFDPSPTRLYTFLSTGGHAPIYAGVITFPIPGVSIGGGEILLFAGKPIITLYPNSFDNAYLVIGNKEGTSWTYKPMLRPGSMTGVVTAINEKTLVCPMYDPTKNEYVLMQTKDLGDTWEKRAVLNKDAPPPYGTIMNRFGILSYMRKNGAPANTFPGSPWVGDNRIAPPWES